MKIGLSVQRLFWGTEPMRKYDYRLTEQIVFYFILYVGLQITEDVREGRQYL